MDASMNLAEYVANVFRAHRIKEAFASPFVDLLQTRFGFGHLETAGDFWLRGLTLVRLTPFPSEKHCI